MATSKKKTAPKRIPANKVTNLNPKKKKATKKVDKNAAVKEKKIPLKKIVVTIQEKREGGYATALDYEAVNRADLSTMAPLVATVLLSAALDGRQVQTHEVYALCSQLGLQTAQQVIQQAIAQQAKIMKGHKLPEKPK